MKQAAVTTATLLPATQFGQTTHQTARGTELMLPIMSRSATATGLVLKIAFMYAINRQFLRHL